MIYVPDSAWDCGVPSGIADPRLGRLVLEAELSILSALKVGRTPFGERRILRLGTGTFQGPRAAGEFLEGGLDWELALPTTTTEVEQVHALRTADGAHVYLRTRGISPNADHEVRLAADFEAPLAGPLAFLNEGTFIGTRTISPTSDRLSLAIYQLPNSVPPDGDVLHTPATPPELPRQSREPDRTRRTRGELVLKANVELGKGFLSVGESKRGIRLIVPITGGRFSGLLSGEVLPGGADFQLLGETPELDARYTLRTDDGELIIVRNRGPLGGMAPLFETRSDGPYAFLNSGEFVSADPRVGDGAVGIAIYRATETRA
jgi:hypothetical protein